MRQRCKILNGLKSGKNKTFLVGFFPKSNLIYCAEKRYLFKFMRFTLHAWLNNNIQTNGCHIVNIYFPIRLRYGNVKNLD